MTFRLLISACILIASGITANAANKCVEKRVTGTYEYYVPRHIALDRAEQIALERAMIEAIAHEFGTVLSLNTKIDMSSSRAGESVDFYSSASSLVKGEWLRTEGEPQFSLRLDGTTIVVTCKVTGIARSISRLNIPLDVRILRNGVEDSAESNVFLSGDKCYLSFTSPVDGFLCVYLEDSQGDLLRMLPFYSQSAVSHRIEANKRYLFFASDKGDEEQYYLTAENGTERNTVYVIFSPNEFFRPADRQGKDEVSLRQLNADDFRKWIERMRAVDDAFQIVPRPISISPEEE